MLACFWFIIVRPKKLVWEMFRKGASLLKKGKTQQALTTFNQALDKAKSNNEKGSIFYNMAICNLRLGQKETAIRALTDAVNILPCQITQDWRFHPWGNPDLVGTWSIPTVIYNYAQTEG